MFRLSLLIAIASMILTATSADARGAFKFPTYKTAEVRAALLDRADESQERIDELKGDLDGATGFERRKIIREIFAEKARKRQLLVFARLVNKLPPAKISRLVAKYDLPVSPHRKTHKIKHKKKNKKFSWAW